ncbi:hypothetical protein Sjap_011712 [Stephania japonica]|uniref:Uncharacterized protein n=1 Tax=Stephania japonica TaxID=461633 RepID=A0AAP0JCW3_9MAGN
MGHFTYFTHINKQKPYFTIHLLLQTPPPPPPLLSSVVPRRTGPHRSAGRRRSSLTLFLSVSGSLSPFLSASLTISPPSLVSRFLHLSHWSSTPPSSTTAPRASSEVPLLVRDRAESSKGKGPCLGDLL